jgi:hypothetical protein
LNSHHSLSSFLSIYSGDVLHSLESSEGQVIVQSLFSILDVLTSWLSKERARASLTLKVREKEEFKVREKEEHSRKEGARRVAKDGAKEDSKEIIIEENEGRKCNKPVYRCHDRKG